MPTWSVPLGRQSARFRDGRFAIGPIDQLPTPSDWRELGRWQADRDQPAVGAVAGEWVLDPWFFPRGCTLTDGTVGLIGHGQWSGIAKVWRSDLDREVTLGRTYANHGRGIRPGTSPGTFELTWLDEDRANRWVAIWETSGEIVGARAVPIGIAAELMPPADGFIGWTDPEPAWTHVPSTIRTVHGRRLGRPCFAGSLVVGDDCDAPSGIDRVVGWNGVEWCAVRGDRDHPWQTHSVQSQIDADGTVGFYGDGDDLLEAFSAWSARPLRVVDANLPAALEDVPHFGGRCFTLLAHVDYSADGPSGPTMPHPDYGNVVLANAGSPAYLQREDRPIVEALNAVDEKKRYAAYIHLSSAGEASSGVRTARAALHARGATTHDRVLVYADIPELSIADVEAFADALEEGDAFSPQFYRRRRNPNHTQQESDLAWAAWMLDTAAMIRSRLKKGTKLIPYLAGYRRGVVDPWLTDSDVERGIVQALRASQQTTWRGQAVAPWDGIAVFGANRADTSKTFVPYLQRASETIVGPVELVRPKHEEPEMPQMRLRSADEWFRFAKDVGPSVAAVVRTRWIAPRVAPAISLDDATVMGYCRGQIGDAFRGPQGPQRDPTVAELIDAVDFIAAGGTGADLTAWVAAIAREARP